MSTEDPALQTQDSADAVERALRAGLEDFELSDEDRALLERGDAALDAEATRGPLPVVAVVGRPNVGKSTLVNRILGRREAVVEDVPGVTRDRVAYDAEWAGREFTVVDTGGWDIDVRGIHLRVAEQAEIAVDLADVVLFVVDATVGATDTDENCVQLLRRSGKPVVLVANKVDDQRGEADAAALWSLGLGEPYPVSALHGRGSGDLLDACSRCCPRSPRWAAPTSAAARAGSRCSGGRTSASRPCSTSSPATTGWSSTASPAPPVTRSTRWSTSAATWRFVDTAGIRRRVHQTRGADFYASLRTQAALEKAEVAVVLVDASEHLRAGHPRDPAGRRRRARPGDRLQQVGPHRRGASPLPRARDRARPRAGAVGAAGQRLGAHRPARGQARARRWRRRWTRGRPGCRPVG